MERNFYTENFENFLKGHADKFKMTPSKKVWHGIYNDIQPGTRWPSVAMSIVFIFTLVIIGHLNTNNGHTIALHNLNSLPAADLVKSIKKSTAAKQSYTKKILNQDNSTTNITDNTEPVTVQLPVIKSIALSSNPANNLPANNEKNNTAVVENTEILPAIIENTVTQTPSLHNNDTKSLQDAAYVKSEPGSETISNINNETSSSIKQVIKKAEPQANSTNIRKPRRNSNVVWTYYVSPSFSYRYLSDDVNNFVIHKPRIGYEAGTEMSFKIFKKLSFTTEIGRAHV